MNLKKALKNLCSSPPKLLTENEFSQVCIKVKEILIDEPNVARINTPVTVVGDVHGQFYDVMEIFKLGGEIPYTNYLFLGDYVDRGYYSIEVLSIFLLLKVIYPYRITLLRGNHESRGITTTYGFYNECKVKYGSEYIWELAMEVFDFFQIASIIDNRIFCIHAGLSPSITFVEQLSLIDRFQEVPPEGPFTDLLWSDPFSSKEGFKPSARNAGYNFGSKVVDKYLKVNSLELILRSHQLIREGYEILFDGKFATVWSAPNYCYVMNNIASILELPTDPNLSNLKDYFNIFVAVPTNERVKPSEPDPEEKKSSTMEYFN
ncbi:serine/threonine-protein phosphatase pp2a-related [Anaeramoeba flamelloides]|uniref:Serine/threonine-protein phosphatase n=1 Tax=Anaeramoeba flamelloides TaxID=1746091 RepID=A0AAV8A2E5_9EUKA|nr:serine/threonine-protein phosphatase pp2a-related [Anaeramoeba flamelloides]KAJ6233232.1 serine/threonine-protein phosphatase pp2a-related [Anaeramoeba flamelloides]